MGYGFMTWPVVTSWYGPQRGARLRTEYSARFYGLDRLPFIPFGELPRDGTRKLGAVAAFIGDRAAAWIDDEIYDDATTWADQREAPTPLIRTAGSIGMTQQHYEQLKRFASDVAADGELSE